MQYIWSDEWEREVCCVELVREGITIGECPLCHSNDSLQGSASSEHHDQADQGGCWPSGRHGVPPLQTQHQSTGPEVCETDYIIGRTKYSFYMYQLWSPFLFFFFFLFFFLFSLAFSHTPAIIILVHLMSMLQKWEVADSSGAQFTDPTSFGWVQFSFITLVVCCFLLCFLFCFVLFLFFLVLDLFFGCCCFPCYSIHSSLLFISHGI